MLVVLSLVLLTLCLILLWHDYLRPRPRKQRVVKKRDSLKYTVLDTSPVPVEDHIVPTHASHTNKMNNMIGNVNSSEGVGPGLLEVVVPSDFYWSTKPPEKYRWPSGSILPDYIYE